MFDSHVAVSDFILELRDETDIAPMLSNQVYVNILNELTQLVYTEIVKEQKTCILSGVAEQGVDLAQISTAENEDNIRFEDIVAVYSGNTELAKTSLLSGTIFQNVYYKNNDLLCLNTETPKEPIKIIYIARPALVKVCDDEMIESRNVMLPAEFLSLAAAKIRGEIYKIVNEDALAAKWLSDYNVLIETFKAWVESKAASFGL